MLAADLFSLRLAVEPTVTSRKVAVDTGGMLANRGSRGRGGGIPSEEGHSGSELRKGYYDLKLLNFSKAAGTML